MEHISRRITVFAVMLGFVCAAPVANAGKYSVSKITHIYTNTDGAVGLKWTGSPRPGPCAASGSTNYGWVMIPPDASDAIKAAAMTTYFKGKKARIDTIGCYGNYEKVRSFYSPGG